MGIEIRCAAIEAGLGCTESGCGHLDPVVRVGVNVGCSTQAPCSDAGKAGGLHFRYRRD